MSVALHINGQPTPCPAVYPSDRPPASGDLVEVAGFTIVLQPEDLQRRWATTGDRSERALVELRGDEQVPVAVTAARAGDAPSTLARLTPAQRAQLRGVDIRTWDPEIGAQLSDTDPSRCAYHVIGCFEETEEPDSSGKVHTTRRLPSLPAGCRHLRVRATSYGGGVRHDYVRLSRYTQLETLSLPGFLEDLGPLRGMTRLRQLSASYTQAPTLEPLAGLCQLRWLDLRSSTLDGLAPLGGLERLEWLSLASCRGNVSLAPLAALPRLRHLDANIGDVCALPAEGWGALAHLEALSTLLPEDEIDAFQERHPGCVVHSSWAGRLAEALRGADRVRVRTGGTCHRQPADERTLAEYGADEAARFLERLQIIPGPDDAAVERWVAGWRKRNGCGGEVAVLGEDAARAARDDIRLKGFLQAHAGPISLGALRAAWRRYLLRGFRCRCCGEPTFEVYAGEVLLAAIGFHHGESIRWDGWPADASLSPDAAAYLRSLIP